MMEIIIETFENPGEPSASSIRVRPAPGQFAQPYRVWCSKSARLIHTPPALFKVQVTIVIPKEREPYLRIDPAVNWQRVSEAEARAFIAERAAGAG